MHVFIYRLHNVLQYYEAEYGDGAQEPGDWAGFEEDRDGSDDEAEDPSVDDNSFVLKVSGAVLRSSKRFTFRWPPRGEFWSICLRSANPRTASPSPFSNSQRIVPNPPGSEYV